MTRALRDCCVAALGCAVLAACTADRAAVPESRESYQLSPAYAGDVGQAAARTAVSLLGSPYRYGGRGPDAFDCSGLVYFSYQAAGLRVPRSSLAQFEATRPIALDQARAGDLVFFRYERKLSHVGIYLGEQRFIHAPSSGKAVSVASLRDPHYRDHFVGAGRF